MESQEHPLHKGKLSAARGQSPCGNGSDPHGGFWRPLPPGLLARCLTHEGRDSFWVFTAPSPRSFPGTDVFLACYHSAGPRAAFLGRQSSEQTVSYVEGNTF